MSLLGVVLSGDLGTGELKPAAGSAQHRAAPWATRGGTRAVQRLALFSCDFSQLHSLAVITCNWWKAALALLWSSRRAQRTWNLWLLWLGYLTVTLLWPSCVGLTAAPLWHSSKQIQQKHFSILNYPITRSTTATWQKQGTRNCLYSQGFQGGSVLQDWTVSHPPVAQRELGHHHTWYRCAGRICSC